jgi:hypothetical protein
MPVDYFALDLEDSVLRGINNADKGHHNQLCMLRTLFLQAVLFEMT